MPLMYCYVIIPKFFRVILVEYEYEEHKIRYELFCVYCERFSGVRHINMSMVYGYEKYLQLVPISFLLGFYVTQVSHPRLYFM